MSLSKIWVWMVYGGLTLAAVLVLASLPMDSRLLTGIAAVLVLVCIVLGLFKVRCPACDGALLWELKPGSKEHTCSKCGAKVTIE